MEADLLDMVTDEFFKAIETKDKDLFREALKALVQHIQDEDAKQDEEMN